MAYERSSLISRAGYSGLGALSTRGIAQAQNQTGVLRRLSGTDCGCGCGGAGTCGGGMGADGGGGTVTVNAPPTAPPPTPAAQASSIVAGIPTWIASNPAISAAAAVAAYFLFFKKKS